MVYYSRVALSLTLCYSLCAYNEYLCYAFYPDVMRFYCRLENNFIKSTKPPDLSILSLHFVLPLVVFQGEFPQVFWFLLLFPLSLLRLMSASHHPRFRVLYLVDGL